MLLSGALAAIAAPIGPLPYHSAADSPFTGTPFSYFHMEDFEDGLLNTPGVTGTGGEPLTYGTLRDSVDGDDGVIDGSGSAGFSWYVGASHVTRFFFSQAVLGKLPTHVGIVWTDVGFSDEGLGFGTVEVEAFDAMSVSLGLVSVFLGDGKFAGEADEDRFFGFVHPGGISAFEIRLPNSTDWEVDHLQYGASPVPEPGSWALGLIGLGALFAGKWRR